MALRDRQVQRKERDRGVMVTRYKRVHSDEARDEDGNHHEDQFVDPKDLVCPRRTGVVIGLSLVLVGLLIYRFPTDVSVSIRPREGNATVDSLGNDVSSAWQLSAAPTAAPTDAPFGTVYAYGIEDDTNDTSFEEPLSETPAAPTAAPTATPTDAPFGTVDAYGIEDDTSNTSFEEPLNETLANVSTDNNTGNGTIGEEDDEDAANVHNLTPTNVESLFPPAVPLPLPATEPAKLGPKGVICSYHPYGRLNNRILEVKGGILAAYALNRTFVMSEELQSLVDVDRLISGFPGLLTKHTGSICNGYTRNKKIIDMCSTAECKLNDQRVLQKYRKITRKEKVLGISGPVLFTIAAYSAIAPSMGLDLDPTFYRYLYPTETIRRTAEEYIEKHFRGKEFAAVHLRDLEGSCKKRMRQFNQRIGLILCNPHKSVMQEVMQDVINTTELDIFVLSDREDRGALKSYGKDAYMYRGPCTELTCPMIDFEIAAQSNFFVGVVVSTAAHTIANLRKYRRSRDVGRQFPSVLSWSREKKFKQWHGGHYFLRHYNDMLAELANNKEELEG